MKCVGNHQALTKRSMIRNCVSYRKWPVLCMGSLTCVFIFTLLSGKIVNFAEGLGEGIRMCSNSKSLDLMKAICKLYKNKDIDGNLCDPLCQDGQIQLIKCLNNQGGKHVLLSKWSRAYFSGRTDTVLMVMKMVPVKVSALDKYLDESATEFKALWSKDVKQLSLKGYDGHESNNSYIQKLIMKKIEKAIQSYYQFLPPEDQDINRLLWDGSSFGTQMTNKLTVPKFIRSFWSLMRQNEYSLSKLFSDRLLFPEIYGSCGPLYISEFAQPENFSNKVVPFFSTWNHRARLAIEILTFIQKTEFAKYSLNLCDVKLDHFGRTRDGELKFIDADTVFLDQTLQKDMGMQSCRQHEDCTFFDCEGWCEGGKCLPLRTNNNLQVICSKIFQSSSIFSSFGGLLSNPPLAIADQLMALTTSCAEDITLQISGVPMKKPTMTTLTTLQRFLIKSLSMIQ